MIVGEEHRETGLYTRQILWMEYTVYAHEFQIRGKGKGRCNDDFQFSGLNNQFYEGSIYGDREDYAVNKLQD